MTLKTTITFTPDQTQVDFNDLSVAQMMIEHGSGASRSVTAPTLLLSFANNQLTAIEQLSVGTSITTTTTTVRLTMLTEWQEQIGYLGRLLMEANQVTLTSETLPTSVPQNFRNSLAATVDGINLVLTRLGYPLTQSTAAKPKPAKTRHRWTKAISTIPFYVDTREAVGTAIWQKRNEMLLKAGAKIRPTAPLNQDGSFGFAAKMGTQLRREHTDQVQDNVTTEDLIFKSVNEIGLFLYFGGTNSWLELVDENGRSIDDWTKI